MERDPVLSDPRYQALVLENAALRTEMAALREAMVRLEKVLLALEGKLAKDSHNSNKPPGSDGPSAPPSKPSAPTGRKRGAQPGHKGKARVPLAEGSESRTVHVELEACPHCACPIPREAITGANTQRVLDLVQQLTEVVNYRLEEGCCPNCQRNIQAPRPPEAGASELGPRLQASAAYLRTQGRMSLSPLQFYFCEVLGINVSRGWLYESGVRTSASLAPTWEVLREEIRASKVLNMDETGLGRSDKDWIWVALSARTVFFHFSTNRGFAALSKILPENYRGILCTDRYATYHKLKGAVRQFCWAHIRREFVALSETKDRVVAALGKRMLRAQERLFELWHRYRREEIGRAGLRRQASQIVSRLKKHLRAATLVEHKDARTLGNELLKHWPKLWTFLRFEGVEPTNNSAERALRPLVILKRIVQRLPSARGKAFFERMATVGATARLRGVPFFQWLLEAIHAAHRGMPIRTLEAT